MKQSDIIAKQLLAAKARMERKDTAAKLQKRVSEANPADKIPIAKAIADIRILKQAKGVARNNAASDLVKMLTAKPNKSRPTAFCTNCGAKAAAGGAFCGECGAKLA